MSEYVSKASVQALINAAYARAGSEARSVLDRLVSDVDALPDSKSPEKPEAPKPGDLSEITDGLRLHASYTPPEKSQPVQVDTLTVDEVIHVVQTYGCGSVCNATLRKKLEAAIAAKNDPMVPYIRQRAWAVARALSMKFDSVEAPNSDALREMAEAIESEMLDTLKRARKAKGA